jgi:hypothetical protein
MAQQRLRFKNRSEIPLVKALRFDEHNLRCAEMILADEEAHGSESFTVVWAKAFIERLASEKSQ